MTQEWKRLYSEAGASTAIGNYFRNGTILPGINCPIQRTASLQTERPQPTPAKSAPLARNAELARNALQRIDEALHVRFGMCSGARDTQQILRRRGTQHRIDVDAFLEQA